MWNDNFYAKNCSKSIIFSIFAEKTDGSKKYCHIEI